MEIIHFVISNEHQDKFSNEIFLEIKKNLIDKFPEELNVNSYKYGPNFYKKLRTLVLRVFLTKKKMIEFFHRNSLIDEKLKLFFKIFFKKAVSSYLRLDDCQQLIEEFVIN